MFFCRTNKRKIAKLKLSRNYWSLPKKEANTRQVHLNFLTELNKMASSHMRKLSSLRKLKYQKYDDELSRKPLQEKKTHLSNTRKGD